MLTIDSQDVNEVYYLLQSQKVKYTQRELTRNGTALVFQEPVLVAYRHPWKRVLFDPVRNANPFFHYMEAIWMLAGRNEVNFLARFVPRMKQYSDDGYKFHGAYGHRWRVHFQLDQLDAVIHMLKRDPTSRRIMLAMWDPLSDLERGSKDLPCNTHIYFRMVDERLDMTVCNRSNDLVWGMCGANVVHMSILQEWVANNTDTVPGTYYQFTNNLHVYEDWEHRYSPGWDDWYNTHSPKRRFFTPNTLDLHETEYLFEWAVDYPFQCPILRDNAHPMLLAWDAYRNDNLPLAIHLADRIFDDDWRRACVNWLEHVEDTRGSK